MLLGPCFVQAQGLTVNSVSVEAITASTKSRTFYSTGDVLIIYKTSTEAVEVQVAATRSKIWSGDIDSVAITGASTAAQKLAKLRLWFFEATTTNGYRSFLPRENIKWVYTSASKRLEMKHQRNDQQLWFGTIDSFQVSGVSGYANKLAYLRATANRGYQTGILSSGEQATVAAGAALGTSPTVAIVGDAVSGEVTFTTGSSTTSTGVLFTVTFPFSAPNGMTTVWSASDADAAGHIARIFGENPAANTFTLNATGTALTAGGTVYKIKYINIAN